MTTRKVSGHLDATADHLQLHGWLKKTWSAASRHTPGSTTPGVAACCVRGAFAATTGHDPFFAEEPYENALQPLIRDGDHLILEPADQDAYDAIRTASEAFARHLRDRLRWNLDPAAWPEVLVEIWNDDPATTQKHVIAELRACAQHERKAGR